MSSQGCAWMGRASTARRQTDFHVMMVSNMHFCVCVCLSLSLCVSPSVWFSFHLACLVFFIGFFTPPPPIRQPVVNANRRCVHRF